MSFCFSFSVILSFSLVILSISHVILSFSLVILSFSLVILSVSEKSPPNVVILTLSRSPEPKP